MMKHNDAQQAADTAAPLFADGLWQHRLRERYCGEAAKAQCPAASEVDKYRWIRANRGNFAIVEALAHSDREGDFDAHIEAAMRMVAAGRHC